MSVRDCVIIGAGPAGIGAALYLNRAKIDFLWLEKSFPGGKVVNLHEVSNCPGFGPMNGFDLAEALLKPLPFSPEIGAVSSLKRNEDGLFEVSYGDKAVLSKTVLIATGLSNSPKTPGEREYLGKGVSYCATCDGPLYKGQSIVLYGEGDRAYEEALYLSGLASTLYAVFPSSSFNPSGEDALSAKDNVVFRPFAALKEIEGDGKRVTGVRLLVNMPGEEREVEICASAVFPLLGEGVDTFFLRHLNPRAEKGFLLVNEDMETSVPGLFAAGDIVFKRLRQIVTALSDGAIASSGIIKYVRGGH